MLLAIFITKGLISLIYKQAIKTERKKKSKNPEEQNEQKIWAGNSFKKNIEIALKH